MYGFTPDSDAAFMMTSTYEVPDADDCAVPDVPEEAFPGALVLPPVELPVPLELLPGAADVLPEVVPFVLVPGAFEVLPAFPLVLPVVADDLFPEEEVPLLTGAVSPSALFEENPSPTMPGPLVAATRSVLWSLIDAIGDANPALLPLEPEELPGPVAEPDEELPELLPVLLDDDEPPDTMPDRNVPLTMFCNPAFV